MSSGFGLFADGRGIVPLPQGRNGIVCRIWRRYKKIPGTALHIGIFQTFAF